MQPIASNTLPLTNKIVRVYKDTQLELDYNFNLEIIVGNPDIKSTYNI